MEVISHWHPNITINIVDDHTPWVKGSVPPPLDQCEPPRASRPLPGCFLAPLPKSPGPWHPQRSPFFSLRPVPPGAPSTDHLRATTCPLASRIELVDPAFEEGMASPKNPDIGLLSQSRYVGVTGGRGLELSRSCPVQARLTPPCLPRPLH